MSEQTTEAPSARRHIIKRPRLTRLLDESSARIILLVAPAGYGKTTLAREWCDSRDGRTAWYQAGTSASDVAALVADLSGTIETIVPAAATALRTRLRDLEERDLDVATLSRLLADSLKEWPPDAFLVIDDYHCVIDSTSQADHLIGSLVDDTPLKLLVGTRRQPSWISARHSIYGDLLTLGRADLAMTPSEVRQVLPHHHPSQMSLWVYEAGGWPALVGLAALTSSTLHPPVALADALHTFFAQELFDATAPDVSLALVKLAVLPTITRDLAQAALAQNPTALLEEGVCAGFLLPHGEEVFTLHPLLREFLLTKISLLPASDLAQVVQRVVRALITEKRWDDAFTVIKEREAMASLPMLLRHSLDDLLHQGRVATIRQWLDHARAALLHDPMIDLAEAECALRRGDVREAIFFSRRAARTITQDDEKRFRIVVLAGQTSHLADDFPAALSYYECAQNAATTVKQARDALWGLFAATHHSEGPGSEAILDQLEAIDGDQTPDDIIRLANGYFRNACLNCTSLGTSLQKLIESYPLIKLATNPHVICGFYGVYAQCFMLTASYEKTLGVIEEGRSAARHYGLEFTLPYFTAMQALALFGLGRLQESSLAMDALVREAHDLDDTDHSRANARVARARLALACGDLQTAIELTDERGPRATAPPMYGEYVAAHALALASSGALDAARAAVTKARSASRAVETETSAKAAEAIIGLQTGASRDAVASLLSHLAKTQHFDAFIAAYRGYPQLLRAAAALPAYRSLLHQVLCRSNDMSFAARLGVPVLSDSTHGRGGASIRTLTRREEEVLCLIGLGHSNTAIARELYISEATVKVHVRHILEKLGARSRTEAAIKFADGRPYAAPSS
jgi:LuxR family maltose regulon positive regulatory protein